MELFASFIFLIISIKGLFWAYNAVQMSSKFLILLEAALYKSCHYLQ